MGIYCTSYCNHGHDTDDGVPVEHECYVLPPAALKAEMDGDFETARAGMERRPLRVHRGRKQSVYTRRIIRLAAASARAGQAPDAAAIAATVGVSRETVATVLRTHQSGWLAP